MNQSAERCGAPLWVRTKTRNTYYEAEVVHGRYQGPLGPQLAKTHMPQTMPPLVMGWRIGGDIPNLPQKNDNSTCFAAQQMHLGHAAAAQQGLSKGPGAVIRVAAIRHKETTTSKQLDLPALGCTHCLNAALARRFSDYSNMDIALSP